MAVWGQGGGGARGRTTSVLTPLLTGIQMIWHIVRQGSSSTAASKAESYIYLYLQIDVLLLQYRHKYININAIEYFAILRAFTTSNCSNNFVLPWPCFLFIIAMFVS